MFWLWRERQGWASPNCRRRPARPSAPGSRRVRRPRTRARAPCASRGSPAGSASPPQPADETAEKRAFSRVSREADLHPARRHAVFVAQQGLHQVGLGVSPAGAPPLTSTGAGSRVRARQRSDRRSSASRFDRLAAELRRVRALAGAESTTIACASRPRAIEHLRVFDARHQPPHARRERSAAGSAPRPPTRAPGRARPPAQGDQPITIGSSWQHRWQREHCDQLLEPEEQGVRGSEFHGRSGRVWRRLPRPGIIGASSLCCPSCALS